MTRADNEGAALSDLKGFDELPGDIAEAFGALPDG